MLLRYIYIIFIGILLALFVGVGIATFYKSPKMPEYRSVPSIHYDNGTPNSSVSAQEAKEQAAYDKRFKDWQDKNEIYERNISIIALTAAIIILVVSLIWLKNVVVIADGLLLGSVFTLIYSIIRGFAAHDEMYRFIVVAIGLVISLLLGYIKFIKPTMMPKKRKA